jgi:hypothetical protein
MVATVDELNSKGQSMRVSGHDVLSERTENSSRFMLIVAASVILVKKYDVKIDDLSFLSVKLPAELFDTAATVVVCYATFSFIQHFLFDVYAWRNWYEDAKIQTWNGEVEIGRFLQDRHDRLVELITKDECTKQNHDSILSYFGEIKEKINEYNSRVKKISIMGWSYIIVQHFLLPVGAAMWAMWLIWGSWVPGIG